MNKPSATDSNQVLAYYAATEPVDNDGIAESKIIGPFLCKSEAVDAAARLNEAGHTGAIWSAELVYRSTRADVFNRAEAEREQQQARNKLDEVLARGTDHE